jgi:hypothetical protein
MERKVFTVVDGVRIQAEQLSGWKKILIPEVYIALEEYAKRDNDKAETGYDICRGTSLDSYIVNYMLGYRL